MEHSNAIDDPPRLTKHVSRHPQANGGEAPGKYQPQLSATVYRELRVALRDAISMLSLQFLESFPHRRAWRRSFYSRYDLERFTGMVNSRIDTRKRLQFSRPLGSRPLHGRSRLYTSRRWRNSSTGSKPRTAHSGPCNTLDRKGCSPSRHLRDCRTRRNIE